MREKFVYCAQYASVFEKGESTDVALKIYFKHFGLRYPSYRKEAKQKSYIRK